MAVKCLSNTPQIRDLDCVCIPCGRKNMLKDKKRHARRATHKQQVIKWLARGRDQPVPGESLSDTRRPVNREEVNQEQQIHDKVDYEADNEAAVNTTSPAANTEEEVRETLEELREHEENRCYQQAEWEREQAPDMSYESWIKYELERIREDEDLDNPADEVHDDGEVDETRDAEEWFPFKNKMEFVGSLLVGYTRNCISRTLFDQIRSILNPICNLKIPAWSTIRRAQKRIREYLHMEPTMKPSVLGTPCATLSTISALQKEIANPLVAPHIDFYPEDSQGKNQFKLSQSKKWLELPRDYRPQMCVNNTRHFFIFEPVELFSKQILVPIYLYKFENKTHSKCVAPTLRRTNSGKHEMRIPANIGFDDPRLVTIKAKEFNVEYSKIQINGRLFHNLFKLATEGDLPGFKKKTKEWVKALSRVKNNPQIRERIKQLEKEDKSRLYNPFLRLKALQREFPGRDFRHIACLQLNKHERISRDYFVLVKSTTSEEYIGRVNSIWSVSTHIFVNVTKFQMADFRGYYGMTEFCKTTDTCSVESKDIVCTLNLQHNCHDGRCPIKMNKTTQIERQEASTRIRQVCHTDQERFILNLTSFHAPKAHRRMSANAFSRVVPETCVAGLNEGHEIWRKKYKQPVKGAKVVWSSDGNSCT
ncbi:hypothetical protein PSTT_10725 [Puccinia striiformis]|uniref:Uncharacterized protein n=1 Tax=Puccinia striiformis TaxID=27350 RepID=A0A2S4V3B1_9BASI|nr:hypothetical protein PSTT_10725 [Puccinia striiformis]